MRFVAPARYINYPFTPREVALMENISSQARALGVAAKFYYTDSTTTLNLYPALIISLLLLFCKLQQTVAKRLQDP